MHRFWVWMISFFPFLAFAGTNDGSLFLYNDSPFILTAVIQAADGSYLGQFTVQPNQQKNFTTNLFATGYVAPGTPAVSITPYTVIWQCPSEGFYAECRGVSPGAFIRASDCPGSHFCSPKKADKKEPPASTLQKKK